MQKIAPGIFYEDGYSGVTLGLLTFPHGTILIDAPLRAEDARAWRNTVNNLSTGTNRILVNLDAHLDRTLGARALETSIVAHLRTAQVYRNRPSVFKGQNADSGAEWESSNEAVGTRWAIPDITFSQKMHFHWGGPEVILEHHPGPGAGSIWVIIPDEKVLFAGDSFLPDQPPFLASADLPPWIESLEYQAEHYSDFTIVSGRGGIVSPESVQTLRQALKIILEGMEKLAQHNASAEETESIIPALVADASIHWASQEHYAQRLRHGLYHYYARRYRPLENPEQD